MLDTFEIIKLGSFWWANMVAVVMLVAGRGPKDYDLFLIKDMHIELLRKYHQCMSHKKAACMTYIIRSKSVTGRGLLNLYDYAHWYACIWVYCNIKSQIYFDHQWSKHLSTHLKTTKNKGKWYIPPTISHIGNYSSDYSGCWGRTGWHHWLWVGPQSKTPLFLQMMCSFNHFAGHSWWQWLCWLLAEDQSDYDPFPKIIGQLLHRKQVFYLNEHFSCKITWNFDHPEIASALINTSYIYLECICPNRYMCNLLFEFKLYVYKWHYSKEKCIFFCFTPCILYISSY